MMETDGSGEERPIFNGPDEYERPRISPTTVSSPTSRRVGHDEIYMRTFPDGGFPPASL